MSSRERPADRGARRGRQLLGDVLREFHDARVAASVSQESVGKAMGRSDAWVSWTESGANTSLSIEDATRLLACVGLDLSVRAYPAGRGIRDEGQLALLAALRARIHQGWGWRTEVPVPIAGDPRAWDVVMRGPDVSIGVEAETRLRDVQAVDRRVMLKLRDSKLDRAILLVADTRTNRLALRELGDSLRANYPIQSREALAALASGRDPGANALIILARPPAARSPEGGGSPP